jgi:group I intron endonuclease
MEFMSFHGFNVPIDNEPLSRPGLYILINRINGKRYVGISKNVRRRIVEHAKGRGCAPVLYRAIRKHGAASFDAIVVLYALHDTGDLPSLEARFIGSMNSTSAGYNVQAASGSVGPYGPQFSASLRVAFSSPEAKARLSAAQKRSKGTPEARAAQSAESKRRDRDPAYLARRTQALRDFNKPPERRAQLSAMVAKLRSDPELEQRRIQRMRETMSTPDFKAKRSASSKRTQARADVRQAQRISFAATAVTPEFKEKRSAASRAVHQRPDVLKRKSESLKAAFADPAARERVAATKRGRIWITDGKNNRCIFPADGIPIGWRRGKSRARVSD